MSFLRRGLEALVRPIVSRISAIKAKRDTEALREIAHVLRTEKIPAPPPAPILLPTPSFRIIHRPPQPIRRSIRAQIEENKRDRLKREETEKLLSLFPRGFITCNFTLKIEVHGDGTPQYAYYRLPGSNNPQTIINGIRDRIRLVSAHPYNKKVKLEQLYINNIEIKPVPTIKYLWQIQLKFLHPDIDQNDEIPNACVPNGLFKIYRYDGTRSTVRNITTIIDVLTILDPLMKDYQISLTKGYTIDDILRFAKEVKITKVYEVDQKFIITKMHEFNGDPKLPRLIIMATNGHLYTIRGKNTRNKIMHSQQKKAIQKRVRNLSNDVYSSIRGEIHQEWIAEAKIGNIYPNFTMDRDGFVTQFNYKGVLVREWLDRNEVKAVHSKYNWPLEYISLPRLAHKYLMQKLEENNWNPESKLSSEGLQVLLDIQVKAINTVTKIPERELHGIDFNRFYTSILMEGGKYGWPQYNQFDAIEKWDGTFKCGFYYMEDGYGGPDWYIGEVAELNTSKPKWQYIPSKVLPSARFTSLIKEILTWPNSKKAVNGMIGIFNQYRKYKNQSYFETDPNEVASYLPDAEINIINAHPVRLDWDDVTLTPEQQLALFLQEIGKQKPIDNLIYHIVKKIPLGNQFTMLPIGRYIYGLANLKVLDFINNIPIDRTLVAIQTDCIVYEGKRLDINESKEIGGVKYVEITNWDRSITPAIKPRIPYKPCENKDWIRHDEWYKLIEARESVSVQGEFGCGKTHTMNDIRAYMDREKISYVATAPTWTAALRINGTTIDSIINAPPNVMYILVDEISMVKSEYWQILLDWKSEGRDYRYILTGDFGQLSAVDDIVSKERIQSSNVIRQLANYNLLELTKNYRINDQALLDDLRALRRNEVIEIGKYGNVEYPLAVAFTNKKCREINKKWNVSSSKSKIIKNWGNLYDGLKIICTDKKHTTEAVNQEPFIVTKWCAIYVWIKSEIRALELKITHSELYQLFELGYCITVHKAQGATFKENFTIYESDDMSSEMLLTAMSRAADMKLINFS